jgi:hypothetical protein
MGEGICTGDVHEHKCMLNVATKSLNDNETLTPSTGVSFRWDSKLLYVTSQGDWLKGPNGD